MAILNVDNVTLHLGDRQLLDGVNLSLERREHIGLVGRNGCGKSTLMKLIAKATPLQIDSGSIHVAKGCSVGYLHQDHALDPERTLIEEAAGAFAHVDSLHDDLGRLAEALATAPENEHDELMREYERIEDAINTGGGWTFLHRVEEALHALGIEDKFFEVKCKDLSGGQRARTALVRVLLTQPDILLLDEPTNHLDIAGRQWLEGMLNDYPGAVVLISHDRWLLDRFATKIFELERGRMVEYPGNYEKFRELRHEHLLFKKREYDKQQEFIKKEKEFIDRFRAGQRARQAQGREKRLDRFLDSNEMELPPELDAMKLSLIPKSRSGDIVCDCDKLGMAYDDLKLFENFTFTVRRGDRIGILGPNGTGKSTLIRCLLGEQEEHQGKSRLGSQVDVGWFRQTHEHLPDKYTIVEYLQSFVNDQNEQLARDLAGAFLFSGDDQDKPISALSGGERARLMLASLMTEGHNLLVLDEPTNHLDIPSAERLEDGLKQYIEARPSYTTGTREGGEGTLLLITHDRMLLDHLVDQLLIFDGKGGITYFRGTYSDFLESDKAAALVLDHGAPVSENSPATTPKAADSDNSKPGKSSKQQRAAQQRKTSRNKALASIKLEDLEARIMTIEKMREEMSLRLADPQIYQDKDAFNTIMEEHEKLGEELERLEEEWSQR